MDTIHHKPEFPHVITAYTTTSHLGEYYKNATARLTKSLIKHNIPFTVYPLNPTTNWTTACSLKPTIIYQHLTTTQKPTLWIDADAEILNYPTLIPTLTTDLALHSQNGHWLTGTLYIHPRAIPFIEHWHKNTNPNEPDEITLLHLYKSHPNPPTITILPTQYNTILHTTTNLTHIIIGHHIRPDIAPARNITPIPPTPI